MVRKKGKAQSSKGKKRRFSSFIAQVKKAFLGASAIVACSIGILFLYNCFSSKSISYEEEKKPVCSVIERSSSIERKTTPRRENKSLQSSVKSQKSALLNEFPQGVEIPALKNKCKEQIIKHEGYTVSYNSDYKIANWVAYELTSREAISKKHDRTNKFVPDPMVKGTTAKNEDYTRTGYDKGHLAPAGDMKWSAKAMRESFYFSNICPQKPGLNRGIWKDLEEQARLWAKENRSLRVVTGPVISDDMKRLGKHRVGVPKSFYKVMCMIVDGRVEGVGFIFENRGYDKTPLRSMMIPIDSVEKVTGIDFFPSLPDSIENFMESRVNAEKWSF